MGELIAVVTGASRGLGRRVAQALGEIGARVVVTGRDEAALQQTALLVRSCGGHPDVQVCDHRDDEAVRALGVWPSPSSTERMLASAGPDHDVAQWSLPIVTGRVIAALARDPDVARFRPVVADPRARDQLRGSRRARRRGPDPALRWQPGGSARLRRCTDEPCRVPRADRMKPGDPGESPAFPCQPLVSYLVAL